MNFKKNQWVKTSFYHSNRSTEYFNNRNTIEEKEVEVVGKVIGAPRFNEEVYWVEYILPTGDKIKRYDNVEKLTGISIKEVIQYKRNNGL